MEIATLPYDAVAQLQGTFVIPIVKIDYGTHPCLKTQEKYLGLTRPVCSGSRVDDIKQKNLKIHLETGCFLDSNYS